MHTPATSTTTTGTSPHHRPAPDQVHRMLERRSFAVLATVSPAGVPHAAGVLYELLDDVMYVNTLRSSRKARNVDAGRAAAVCVVVRRLPLGPPSTIHFQAAADVVATDHPDVVTALEAGALQQLTGHGELELPDSCFLRITVPRRVLTYGLGMSLRRLIADPLGAGGSVELGPR